MASQRQVLGLIGRQLSHSHSPRLFQEIFSEEGVSGWTYKLFELPTISALPQMLATEPSLRGFNVTIPYKRQVFAYLDYVNAEAKAVGAVNTVSISKAGDLTGCNTDVKGFDASLKAWIPPQIKRALILGSGGASKAAQYVLAQRGINYLLVSRSPEKGDLTYADLDKNILSSHPLIIQTTPVGMASHIENELPIPFEFINDSHYVYDMIYNPPLTHFLKICKKRGATVKNGEEMLYLQAIAAWKIWNT